MAQIRNNTDTTPGNMSNADDGMLQIPKNSSVFGVKRGSGGAGLSSSVRRNNNVLKHSHTLAEKQLGPHNG